MNILLITGPNISLREPFSSGIEVFIVSLANQLVKNGHSVDVIAKNAESDALFNIIKVDGKLFDNQSSQAYKHEQMVELGSLDIEKYDVIHYNLFIPEMYTIAAKFNKPSILTLHSPADRERVRVYKKFAKESNVTFVAVSQRIKRQWELALRTNILNIHNGIVLEKWPMKQRADGDYLLWSARINEEKNVKAAIDLAIYVNQPLKIVGKITDQRYFNTNVKPYLNDQIQYVGHVTQKNLSELSANASVFLATAQWQEPFGLAVLEMLASGVPVVGFETAVPQELRHKCVLTVPSTNWRDLVEPLSQISSTVSPQHCRDFAATMSVEAVAQRYADIYQSIVDNEITDSVTTAMPHDLPFSSMSYEV